MVFDAEIALRIEGVAVRVRVGGCASGCVGVRVGVWVCEWVGVRVGGCASGWVYFCGRLNRNTASSW